MRRSFGTSKGRFACTQVLLAAFFLLFPGSGFVLCIAPGSHIAVERISAECCKSSPVSASAAHPPHIPCGVTGNCAKCIDLPITSYGREAIPQWHFDSARDMQACECLENIVPEDPSNSPSRRGISHAIEAPNKVPSSIPLRC